MNTKPAVLIVDDDAAVRSSLKFALEVEGFRVRVYDGAAALLDRCGCQSGCPSCVGPLGDIGEHGKATAKKILAAGGTVTEL